jgi:hypothetical protein
MSASYCNLAKRETKVSADIELTGRGKGDLFLRLPAAGPADHHSDLGRIIVLRGSLISTENTRFTARRDAAVHFHAWWCADGA